MTNQRSRDSQNSQNLKQLQYGKAEIAYLFLRDFALSSAGRANNSVFEMMITMTARVMVRVMKGMSRPTSVRASSPSRRGSPPRRGDIEFR